MKKFAFTLQNILNLRQYDEDRAKLELGRAVSVVNRIEADLTRIAENKANAGLELEKNATGVLNMLTLLSIENYIKLLDEKKARLIHELAAAQLVVEQKRAVFSEAMKKRTVLTKLSERQQEAWKVEFLREEDLVLDEIGSHLNRVK